MYNDLFSNDINLLLNSIAIDISTFNNKRENSLEWLKQNSHKINKDSKKVFDYFFKANNIQFNEIPQYHCSPYWGDVTNNYKLRFVVLKDNNIYHLVLLRIIGIMYHEQFFCITYRVLSSDGTNREQRVLDVIKNIDCIKKIERIVDKEDDWDNCNFYCTTDNLSNINTKRRTQRTRAFKLLERGINVQVLNGITLDFDKECDDLFETFIKYRFKFNKKVNRKMIDLVIKDNTKTAFIFKYKNKIIGLQIACNDFIDIASIHVAKDISSFPLDLIASKYTNGDYDLAKEIRNYLGILREEYVKSECLKKYPALYIDGAHGDKGKYLNHKRKHYDKCIYYKLFDINE